MAQPVWVLSVDLTTKTASFQTGMAEAAKTARGAFTEIQSGSGAMGAEVGANMSEARHGVMMLGEEFGIHLPRGLTTFIASIGPVGAVMEAAFPFLAIALGATLLLEHLSKMHEAGEKLTEDQMKFGTSVQTAFNSLDDKLLQAGIRTDELRNNHVGALAKQLELIDHQSMAELAQEFGALGKIADSIFADLKKSWYQFGSGSAGAKASLDTFTSAYDSLLAKADDKGAAALLEGKVAREQKILDLRKEAASTSQQFSGAGGDPEKFAQHQAALNKLKEYGGGFDKDEIAAGQTLLDTLQSQVSVQQKVGQLKAANSANATTSSHKSGDGQAAAAARQAAETQMRINEQGIASEKDTADAMLTIHHASIEDRLASDLAFAQRDEEAQRKGNAAEINALDKSGKDYGNQLKGLKEKQAEITSAYNLKVAALNSHATIEEAARTVSEMQQGEREKISNTQEGSAARLAAINAGIQEEQAQNIKDSGFIKDLMLQRVNTTRQMAEEEAKLKAEAAKEEASNSEKMGELQIQAEQAAQALMDSSHRVNAQQRIAEETKTANDEFQLKMQALDKEIAGLDKAGKEYNNKKKQLQDQERQMTAENANSIAAIAENAQKEQNQRILSADTAFKSAIASGLTKSIMGHQSWAKSVTQMGQQVVAGMIENAIKSMLTQEMTKEKDDAAAARKAFNIGMGIGGPAGMILGPLFGAAAFASVMAFEGGGVVPGVGTGDTVPAMLTPGEGVVPKGVMEGLSDMSRNGNMGGGTSHVQMAAHFSPTVHAMDSEGVDRVLEKHNDKFQQHFQRTLRKMNR
jgi:hypothetical protein